MTCDATAPEGAKESSPARARAPRVLKRGARAKCWVYAKMHLFLAPQAGAQRSGAPLKNAFRQQPEECWPARFGRQLSSIESSPPRAKALRADGKCRVNFPK